MTEADPGGQISKSWKLLEKNKISPIFGKITIFYCIISLVEVISTAKTNSLPKIKSVELAGVELAVCRISRPLLYMILYREKFRIFF